MAVEQVRVLAHNRGDFAPQDFLQVLQRRCGGDVNFGVRVDQVKPDDDTRRGKALTHSVSRPGYGDGVIADGLHDGAQVIGILLVKDLGAEGVWIVAILRKLKIQVVDRQLALGQLPGFLGPGLHPRRLGRGCLQGL